MAFNDDAARTHVKTLVRLFFIQVTSGCSSEECSCTTCYSYRLRTADRPLREYTVLSARAAAFYLASLDNAAARLCPRILDSSKELLTHWWDIMGDEPGIRPDLIQQPKDEKAFAQSLFDTQAMRNLYSEDLISLRSMEESNQAFTPLYYLDAALDNAWSSLSMDPTWAVSGAAAMSTCISAPKWFDEKRWQQTWGLDIRCSELCFGSNDTPEQILSFLRRRTHVLAHLMSLGHMDDEPVKLASHNPETVTQISNLVADRLLDSIRVLPQTAILSDAEEDEPINAVILACLAESTFEVFLHEWNGKSTVHSSSLAGKALYVLKLARNILVDALKYEMVDPILALTLKPNLIDVLEAASSWLQNPAGSIFLVEYPWLFDQSTQCSIFRALCFRRMETAVEEAQMHLRLLVGGLSWHSETPPQVRQLMAGTLRQATSRKFSLKVSRHNLLEDLFNQLWQRETRELLRPLVVEIKNEGEEGQDQGGVAQEMFQAALSELLQPGYKLFTVDPVTRMAWFDPQSVVSSHKFEIMGVLFALAVHNGFVLPVTFPLALYKKLLKFKVESIGEIRDGWPALAKGLTELRDWTEGEVEDVFARSYVFSFEAWDQIINVDMTNADRKVNWSLVSAMEHSSVDSEIAPLVTNENRRAFIHDYIEWLTHISIQRQFDAFARGFYSLLPSSLLTTLTPRTLQLLTEGHHIINISALQAAASYDNGYTAQTPIIRAFWGIVHEYDEDHRRRLLEFVTASARLPANGVAGLDFVIQRNGGDCDRLPTSMTCFARLLLPEYAGMEKLAEKLEVALRESRGFGLR